jgi:enamine deaminase RidA (YjgF/YER057c/UK114 family)
MMAATSAFANDPNPLIKPINPPGVSIPNISMAVRAEAGKVMFLSGHVPADASGKFPTGLEQQLDQVFSNMAGTLKAAGTDFRSLARITIYVKGYDPSMLDTIRKVRDKYVDPRQPPASALIGVQSLFLPEVLVEVDAVAIVN